MSDSQRVGTDDAVVQAGLSMGTASETKHDAPLHMTPAAMVICLVLAIAGCGKRNAPQPPPDVPHTYPRPYPNE